MADIGSSAVKLGGGIPPAVVNQAIAWYVQWASGMQTAEQRQDFERWLQADVVHAQAWRRFEQMGDGLRQTASLAGASAGRQALQQAPRMQRRRALRQLLSLGAGGLALYGVQSQVPWQREWQAARADVRTATGEQRRMVLADGTRVQLNTGTALSLIDQPGLRGIVLHRGEIQIETAADPQGRLFLVQTYDGVLMPLGTVFRVRRDAGWREASGQTELSVTEGEVALWAGQQINAWANGHAPGLAQASVRVDAGRQVRFARQGVIQSPTALEPGREAWADGMLIAANRRLDDLIAELARYHPGWLRCDEAAGKLRVTGSWPLQGKHTADAVLESIAMHLPIRVRRWTDYWVSVEAA